MGASDNEVASGEVSVADCGNVGGQEKGITVSEQLGLIPSSPVTSLPSKLSSAIVTADGSRSRDLEPDRLLQLELTISVPVLREIEFVLATTDKSGEGPCRHVQL